MRRGSWPGPVLTCLALTFVVLALTGCTSSRPTGPGPWPTVRYRAGRFVARPLSEAAAAGITKIKHVVIITQENRSFDSYFGTYPGAVGLGPRRAWPCLLDPHGGCVRPHHLRADVSAGGPHSYAAYLADADRGAMDGFVTTAANAKSDCKNITAPACGFSAPRQVMGYYDRRELANYWAYARRFVLLDHFFEAANSWSLPQHLYLLAGWSARCSSHDPMSCQGSEQLLGELAKRKRLNFAFTDLTYLLHAYGVSWRYYVKRGLEPDCINPAVASCQQPGQAARRPGIWNPLPQFDTVHEDRQLHNIQNAGAFFPAARAGRLPAVSWVTPNGVDSEHPPGRVSDGQAWVTRIVNAVMHGSDWKSTAIFLNWDDWGGYYDGVVPPAVDGQGYGLRVPALIISPYARVGTIDHAVLSSDAYLKFIEDRWLGGQRLDPRTDGRPDPRPDVRESAATLGDLLSAFNFRQKPQPPLILPPRPHTDLVEPAGFPPSSQECTDACLYAATGIIPSALPAP